MIPTFSSMNQVSRHFQPPASPLLLLRAQHQEIPRIRRRPIWRRPPPLRAPRHLLPESRPRPWRRSANPRRPSSPSPQVALLLLDLLLRSWIIIIVEHMQLVVIIIMPDGYRPSWYRWQLLLQIRSSSNSHVHDGRSRRLSLDPSRAGGLFLFLAIIWMLDVLRLGSLLLGPWRRLRFCEGDEGLQQTANAGASERESDGEVAAVVGAEVARCNEETAV